MEKIAEEGLLFDYYGPLLTEHQRRIYGMAVCDDLSLGEIAAIEHISRQAVHDLLRRSTQTMQEYEDRLGLIGRADQIRRAAEELAARARSAGTLEELVRQVEDFAGMIRKDF